MMVVVPVATAVTSPEADTVATSGVLLVHSTIVVQSLVVESLYVHTAESCCCPPATIVVLWVIAMLVTILPVGTTWILPDDDVNDSVLSLAATTAPFAITVAPIATAYVPGARPAITYCACPAWLVVSATPFNKAP